MYAMRIMTQVINWFNLLRVTAKPWCVLRAADRWHCACYYVALHYTKWLWEVYCRAQCDSRCTLQSLVLQDAGVVVLTAVYA